MVGMHAEIENTVYGYFCTKYHCMFHRLYTKEQDIIFVVVSHVVFPGISFILHFISFTQNWSLVKSMLLMKHLIFVVRHFYTMRQ